MRDYGAKIRVVYVEASRDALRVQNRAREEAVPDSVTDALLERWDAPDRTEAHTVEYVVEDGPSPHP